MSRRRRLGQNFLIDDRVTDSILELLAPDPRRVLEIGPGQGALTLQLATAFDTVLALEIDEGLIPELRRKTGDAVTIAHGDGLTVDFPTLLADGDCWQVAANLPYSVGTAILRRLLTLHPLITRMVVMLQKEVAERVVAEPGERNHGLLALEREAHADARLAFTVSPQSFRPRPRVDSAVIIVDLRPCKWPEDQLARALKIASHALTKPRKMLPNALKPLIDPEIIDASGIDARMRPAELTLEQWIHLAERNRAARMD